MAPGVSAPVDLTHTVMLFGLFSTATYHSELASGSKACETGFS